MTHSFRSPDSLSQCLIRSLQNTEFEAQVEWLAAHWKTQVICRAEYQELANVSRGKIRKATGRNDNLFKPHWNEKMLRCLFNYNFSLVFLKQGTFRKKIETNGSRQGNKKMKYKKTWWRKNLIDVFLKPAPRALHFEVYKDSTKFASGQWCICFLMSGILTIIVYCKQNCPQIMMRIYYDEDLIYPGITVSV